MSSNFLRFQLFCTKSWHLALGKFFPQNSNSFSRHWGPNFGPFRAKSDSMNEIATLKANICVKNIVKVFLFFIFWKYGLNYTRKSKFWPSYACCCLEIMAWNHKNLNFCQTLRLHISHDHHLHILFSVFCESHLGVLILCGAKIMCKQGPGTEWSLKIQFLFKNCFAMQPIMVVALGLVQNVSTL